MLNQREFDKQSLMVDRKIQDIMERFERAWLGERANYGIRGELFPPIEEEPQSGGIEVEKPYEDGEVPQFLYGPPG